MIAYPKDARKEGQLETDGTPRDRDERRLAQLYLATLGVVFGDIGTSPLYALRECFYGAYGIAVSDMNILGVLSLMFWALIIIVTIKYMVFMLRADNHGEGGILALTALMRIKSPRKNLRWALVATGLFGASLLYGDGVITPAISVLSAIEGIGIITPVFMPYIVPATLIILASLFLVQGSGTERIGALFGPIILVWFSVIGSLGFVAVVQNPKILASVLPWHALDFLLKNQHHGFLVLGAVFLVVTGAEALSGKPDMVPWALLHNLTHNKILHSDIAFLHFSTEEIPRVPNNRKIEITKLGTDSTRLLPDTDSRKSQGYLPYWFSRRKRV